MTDQSESCLVMLTVLYSHPMVVFVKETNLILVENLILHRGIKKYGKNMLLHSKAIGFVIKLKLNLHIRDLPRFFDQVGHQTTYAYIGKKHFFTKSCHRQTYQNYEQPPQRLQNLYFQSHFSASKINRIFLIFFL